MDLPESLQQAIDTARAGQITKASRMLARYVTQDPDTDLAWLWLAACLDEPEQQQYCLKRAGEINPNNPSTVEALADYIWAQELEAKGPAIELLSEQPAATAARPPQLGETFTMTEAEAPIQAPVVEAPVAAGAEPAMEYVPEPLPPVEVVPYDKPLSAFEVTSPEPVKKGLTRPQVSVLILLVIAILISLAVLGYSMGYFDLNWLPLQIRQMIGLGLLLP